jgi:hypothetical protein
MGHSYVLAQCFVGRYLRPCHSVAANTRECEGHVLEAPLSIHTFIERFGMVLLMNRKFPWSSLLTTIESK